MQRRIAHVFNYITMQHSVAHRLSSIAGTAWGALCRSGASGPLGGLRFRGLLFFLSLSWSCVRCPVVVAHVLSREWSLASRVVSRSSH